MEYVRSASGSQGITARSEGLPAGCAWGNELFSSPNIFCRSGFPIAFHTRGQFEPVAITAKRDGGGSTLASVWLEQWTELLGGKSHGLMALDETGNLAHLDLVLNGSPACHLVLHWENIRIRDPLQNAKLSRLIRAGMEYDETSAKPLPPPVRLPISDERSVYIDVIPLPPAFRQKLDGAMSLLSIREVENQPGVSAELLQQEFHLTPSEASVAVQLSNGLSLKQAAQKLNISIWTARSHLRAVFQKTNTHRQGELVSLLAHIEH